MKATIEVANRQEGQHIQQALEDPQVRAFVLIIGILKPMSPHARDRVMRYVDDRLEEPNETLELTAGVTDGDAA